MKNTNRDKLIEVYNKGLITFKNLKIKLDDTIKDIESQLKNCNDKINLFENKLLELNNDTDNN